MISYYQFTSLLFLELNLASLFSANVKPDDSNQIREEQDQHAWLLQDDHGTESSSTHVHRASDTHLAVRAKTGHDGAEGKKDN